MGLLALEMVVSGCSCGCESAAEDATPKSFSKPEPKVAAEKRSLATELFCNCWTVHSHSSLVYFTSFLDPAAIMCRYASEPKSAEPCVGVFAALPMLFGLR